MGWPDGPRFGGGIGCVFCPCENPSWREGSPCSVAEAASPDFRVVEHTHVWLKKREPRGGFSFLCGLAHSYLKLQKAIIDASGSRHQTLKPIYRFNLQFYYTQKGSSHVPLGTPFQFPVRELTLFLVPLLTSQKSRHLCSKNSSTSSSCLMVILPVKKELEKQAACHQRGLG